MYNDTYTYMCMYMYRTCRTAVQGIEDWLYDEGEDCSKSVYIAKLEELKAKGAAVEQRWARAPFGGGAGGRREGGREGAPLRGVGGGGGVAVEQLRGSGPPNYFFLQHAREGHPRILKCSPPRRLPPSLPACPPPRFAESLSRAPAADALRAACDGYMAMTRSDKHAHIPAEEKAQVRKRVRDGMRTRHHRPAVVIIAVVVTLWGTTLWGTTLLAPPAAAPALSDGRRRGRSSHGL